MTKQEGDADRDRATESGQRESTDSTSHDADLPAPRPDRSPENVLRTVLSELGDNDSPHPNAGVRTAFDFASPAYREKAGGSFEDFRDQMTNPIHGSLIDYERAKRGQLRNQEDSAVEKVVVTDDEGEEVTYEFTLTKVEDGKYEGCWMIDDIELVYVGASPDHYHMPVVEFDGTEVKCKEGAVLRDVLLRASGVSPHNEAAQYANCNGRGLCGTCAVEVEGEVSDKTAQEKRRLKMPPHRDNDDPNFRLACQCRVLGDLNVQKHEGMWGQHVQEYASGTQEQPEATPIRVTDDEYRTGSEDVQWAEGEGSKLDDDEEAETDAGEDLGLSGETQSLLEDAEQSLEGEDDLGEGDADPDDVELTDETQELLSETEDLLSDDE